MSKRKIPANAIELKDDQSDAVAYLHDYNGFPAAAVYCGRRSKPMTNCYFKTVEARDARIERDFNSRREYKKMMERMRGPHSMKVGDIMVSSWGWEQTNVDFYQVVAVTRAFVYVRQISSENTSIGDMRGTCMPVKDSFMSDDAPARYKCNNDNAIKLASYARATKWDGNPKSWTSYA